MVVSGEYYVDCKYMQTGYDSGLIPLNMPHCLATVPALFAEVQFTGLMNLTK